MARSIGTSVENSFVKGLVTEATGLNFPENACTDTDNCVFDTDGLVTRRLGFDSEEGFINHSIPVGDRAVNEYLWQSVNGNGDLTVLVQQIGNILNFWRVTDGGSISTNFITALDLNSFSTGNPPGVSTNICQFTSGFGYLFVAHPFVQTIYVKFDSALTSVTANPITISIRDTAGIDDGAFGRIETASGSVTNGHIYNLFNQGWSIARIYQFAGYTATYPSDYDVWWLFKDSNENFDPIALANKVDRGNSLAPRGSVIFNAFNQDRANVTGTFLNNLPSTTSGQQRPSTLEFFAGRVFYSGINSDGYNNKIYFTQIIEGSYQFGSCYQANDPTSEFAADLLATDGGSISIGDCGTIIRIWSIEGALMVFATNGIWQISGSSGLGFTANDYMVKKISTIQALSRHSFIEIGGLPAWWSVDGIYTVQVNSQLGTTQVTSLTDKSIESFYLDIPLESKKFAKGAFNINSKIAQWIYRHEAPTNTEQDYSYNRILNLNVQSGAFYPWSVSNTACDIKGITCVRGVGTTVTDSLIVSNLGYQVVDESFNNVTTVSSESSEVEGIFKYTVFLGTTRNFLTYAEEKAGGYTDWVSIVGLPGLPYTSYLDSGYRVRGDGQRKFQANYVTIYSATDKDTNYYFQGKWDYAISGNTGRWSSSQLVVHTIDDYEYKPRRLKIRGHGKALQFRLESFPGMPFGVIGWVASESVNGGI